MDDTRFDRLTRMVLPTPTRRGFTQILAGLALGEGLGSPLGPAAAGAKNNKNKKKHKHKNQKKKCKTGTKMCNGECITATHCCGGCAYYSSLTCCDGRCANCCSGDDCESGVCIHGVCFAAIEDDCPPSLAAMTREKGGAACVFTNTTRPCDDDDNCEFGSICLSGNVCSTPIPLPE